MVTLKTTRRNVEAVTEVLKKRFNNLTVVELNKLVFDILEAIEEAEAKDATPKAKNECASPGWRED